MKKTPLKKRRFVNLRRFLVLSDLLNRLSRVYSFLAASIFFKTIARTSSSRVFKTCLVVTFFCCVSLWTSEVLIRTSKDIAINLFGNAESIAIGSAAVVFFLEIPERKKRNQYEAWQIINSALGQTGNGGRVQALEDLNRDGVALEGVSAPKADLSGVDLSRGRLARANFSGTQLDMAILRGADLRFANLRKANLRGADLRGADLRCVNLSEADLSEADLRGTKLNNADLRKVSLYRANLREAALDGANLSHANLHKADLRNSFLSHANLSEAYMAGTKLFRAYLSDADMSGVEGILKADLSQAWVINTKLPENISGMAASRPPAA